MMLKKRYWAVLSSIQESTLSDNKVSVEGPIILTDVFTIFLSLSRLIEEMLINT
jgi:hypothetical protein